LRGAALPAGRLLIDLIRRDVDLTMEFTDSVAPGPNDHKPMQAQVELGSGKMSDDDN
jgi:hypothetical protein